MKSIIEFVRYWPTENLRHLECMLPSCGRILLLHTFQDFCVCVLYYYLLNYQQLTNQIKRLNSFMIVWCCCKNLIVKKLKNHVFFSFVFIIFTLLADIILSLDRY